MDRTLYNIGKIIRSIRKSKKMTIQSLAVKINKSDNFIGNIERGENYPSIQTLIDLSNIFDVGIDYFVKDELTIYKNNDPINYKSKEIINKINNLSEEKLIIIEEIIDLMLKI